ncbi:hypothetical protein Mapa_009407 [Marchantia paleacea]|nr:hypothetical protein Mapa_009407 [Marchantia paleacea]
MKVIEPWYSVRLSSCSGLAPCNYGITLDFMSFALLLSSLHEIAQVDAVGVIKCV